MFSKWIRIYFIGIVMGIADLVPGVSGGTVAFISGIYEELLESIKTLQLQSLRKVAWPFFLPLGMGVLTAVILFSPLFYYLLMTYPNPLFAFFFGLIVASAYFCGKKAQFNTSSRFLFLAAGALAAFLIAGIPEKQQFGFGFFELLFAGIIAAFAMLLPGISGSFVLQLFGIYPFLLTALKAPGTQGSFRLLLILGLGASLGFVFFSRLVSWLLSNFTLGTYAILVGFMLGGTRAIWPFHKEGWFLSILFAFIGFFIAILLEMRMKKISPIHRV